MKLVYTATSPYVRRVAVTIAELGLDGHPRLADWYERFAGRPSMRQTVFRLPATG